MYTKIVGLKKLNFLVKMGMENVVLGSDKYIEVSIKHAIVGLIF